MGRDHSVAPRAMAGVGSPRIQTASMIPCRSIAMEMARRTRTSLKSSRSVRMYRTDAVTLDRKSWYTRLGWLFLRASRSCCRTLQLGAGPQWICPFRQKAIVGELHVIGHQLAAIERRFVVPFNAVAQMEDIGRVVWLLPAFGQVRLDGEGAGPHIRTDFIPHQRAIGEAQGSI